VGRSWNRVAQFFNSSFQLGGTIVGHRKDRVTYKMRDQNGYVRNTRRVGDREMNHHQCQWPGCTSRAHYRTKDDPRPRWDRDHCYCFRHYRRARLRACIFGARPRYSASFLARERDAPQPVQMVAPARFVGQPARSWPPKGSRLGKR
jgi:hypothetical protein